MKKKLALILSIVLALAVAICIFAFSASAEELPYAETQAANLWGSSEISKATSVTVGSTVIDLTTDGTGAIAEGGTYAVKDGKLTLTGVGTSAQLTINANGGLWLEVNNNGAVAQLRFAGTPQDQTLMGQKRSPLIITSSDGVVLKCGNIQNHHGDIILMGKISMNDTTGGYHKLLIRNNADTAGKGYDIIVGVDGNITLSGAADNSGNIIENNSGSVIVSGKTTLTLNGTGTSIDGIEVTTVVEPTATVSVLEDANLNITLTNGLPIFQNTRSTSDVDNVVFDTTGTVKLKVTSADIKNWYAGAIYNHAGSVAIKNGKVLMDYTAATYSDGCANVIFINNANSNYGTGLKVSGGELAIKTTSNATGAVRLNGTWVNYGVAHFTGDAKVSYDIAGTSNQDYPINIKIGEVRVADNAKVFLKGTDRVIRIETSDLKNHIAGNTPFLNHWRENAGLHVTGGQLEGIGSMFFDIATTALDEAFDGQTETKWLVKKNFTISGGVVLAHITGKYVSGLGFNAAENITNQRFVGNLVRTSTYTFTGVHGGYDRQWNDNTSGISATARPDWAYFANEATYTYYNGIAANADFFGAPAAVDSAIVDVTYDANGKATYKYTVPLSANYKLLDGVYNLTKDRVILSDEPLSLAMTNDAVTRGNVYFLDTDGVAYTIIDNPADDAATVLTAKNGGTISYDAKANLLALNGVNGKTLETNGVADFTIDFNGTNNFSSAIWARHTGKLVFKGDDNTTDIVNINTSSQYAFGSAANATSIEVLGFTLNITSTAADGIHNSEGNNTFTFGKDAIVNVTAQQNAIRIRSTKGTFVTDNAKITATSNTNGAFQVQQGNLTVSGTAQIIASTAKDTASTGATYGGVHVNAGNMTVEGDVLIDATASSENGIVTYGNYVQKGGTVTATIFSTASCNGMALHVNGDATISGGTLTAVDHSSAAKNAAIMVTGKYVQTNGTVTAAATARPAVSASGSIAVSGGKLDVETVNNYAIIAPSVSFTGGEIYADATGVAKSTVHASNGELIIGGTDTPVTVNVNSDQKTASKSCWALNGNVGKLLIGKNATVNVWAGYAAIHAKAGGDLIIEDNAVVNAWAGQRNLADGGTSTRGAALMADGASIYIKGGTVNAESAGEQTVAAFANSNYAGSGVFEISGGTLTAKNTSLGRTIFATTINIKGGEMLATSASERALSCTNLNVTGGTLKAHAATKDYSGVVVTGNYKQTGGDVEIYIDGASLTSGTAIGLNFSGGTSASFEGGTLHIAEINSDPNKTMATYAIWSNSTNLDFKGTDVTVDMNGTNTKGWANCAVKVQVGKQINISGGSLDVRGGSHIDIFRLDDNNCAINVTGGEITGVVGRFVSINPGENNTTSVAISKDAKIDIYYLTQVARVSSGTLDVAGIASGIWMKNAAWTDGYKWLTTNNWTTEGTENPSATQVKLVTKDGTFFLSLDGVRQYPASATNPIFVLSAEGKLLKVSGASVAKGEIYTMEANGDFTLDVPAGETLNLGTKDHGYNIYSMNGITIKGKVNIETSNNGITARGDINFQNADVRVEILSASGSNPIQATGNVVIADSIVTSISKGHTAIRADGTVTIERSEVNVSNPLQETLLGNTGVTIVDSNVTATSGTYNAIGTRGGSITIVNSTVKATSATNNAMLADGTGDITITNSKVTAITTLEDNSDVGATPRVLYAKGNFTLEGEDSVLVVKNLATTSNTYGPRMIEAGKNLYFNGGKMFLNCDEGSTVTVNADGTITHNLVNGVTSAVKFGLKSGGAGTTMNFNGTDAIIAGYQQTIHTQGGGINVTAGTVSVISAGNYAPIRIQGAGVLNVTGGTLNLVGSSTVLENYKQTGGTVNAFANGDAFNCSGANLSFNVSGGNFNLRGGSCGIRYNATTKAEVNISGGNVYLEGPGQVLYLNGSGTNTVSFTGGTTTINHNTENAYRPIQLNGTGTVNVSGDAKLYALGNGYHSIQATNVNISDNAYVKATTKLNGSGAYFAIAATNLNISGGTVELSAGSTSVVNATNYTQTGGAVSIKSQQGASVTGLRSMNANITGGSIDFALSLDAFEPASGNDTATHNGIVNIGGTAKITGYAARFFDGNASAQLNISGTPTIDFYNNDGTTLRNPANADPIINTGDVQFVYKCKPQDKGFFITTANAVTGLNPSMVVIVDNSNVPHLLVNEDGKREFTGGGTATLTNATDLVLNNLNARGIRSNGTLNVTGTGANKLTASTLWVATGDLTLENVNFAITGNSNGAVKTNNGKITIENATVSIIADYNGIAAYGDGGRTAGVYITDSTVSASANAGDNGARTTGDFVIDNSDVNFYAASEPAAQASGMFEVLNGTTIVAKGKTGANFKGNKGILIKDSTVYSDCDKGSTIDNLINPTGGMYGIQSNTKVVIDNSTVVATGDAQAIHANGQGMDLINNSKIYAKTAGQYAIRAQGGNIVIDGADVKAVVTGSGYYGMHVQTGDLIVKSGSLNINTNAKSLTYIQAGNYTQTGGAFSGNNILYAQKNITIDNGTVDTTGVNSVAGNFTMNGGTVTTNGANNIVSIQGADTVTTINGGTLNSTVTGEGAIRVNKLIINGGTVNATANGTTGYAIMGATKVRYNGTNQFIMNGGTVNVYAPNGAESALDFGNISINGGVLTATAKSYALRGYQTIEILGGDVVLNADTYAVHTAYGPLTFGGDAEVTASVKDGYCVYAQSVGVKTVIKDDVKLNLNQTAAKATWQGALNVYDLEMLGGEVNIDIDCAPFVKYEQRIPVAINVQGSNAYNYGVMNLKGGNIYIDINNNYNDAGYTILEDGKDVKSTNANRTFAFFFKNVSAANFDGTNVESNIHTLMANGTSGHISVQGNDAVINVNGGKLAFNATGDITTLFAHTVNGGKINLNGGEITGSANYFWHGIGGMNKVLTVKPEMKIDFYNYSGDAVALGTYNANNQSYYNWYVDTGVEYLTGCSLKDNSQFVTTGNMTVEGSATQVEIKVKEGTALKTYALTVLAQDPDNSTAVPNRAYPAGAGPMEAKAYLKANGELILNDLYAQSLAANGDIDLDLNGTSTLVKNGNHTLYSTGDLTIGGDGVLEMSGTDYVVYALGNEINFNDKSQVKIIATTGNAIHLNNYEATTSVNILDDANLVIEATENFSVDKDGKVSYSNNGRGIYIRGIDTSVNVGDNAVLDITATDQGIYVLSNNGAEGDITKATVNIGGNANVNFETGPAIQVNANVASANVNGNAVINMTEASRSFYATGADASVNIGGNAQVLVDKSTGDGLTIQSNVLAPEGVKQNASLTVSDKANFIITEASSCGARISITATDAVGQAVPGSTAFIVSDEANVEMTGPGQTVYLLANVTGGTAKFAITDKATATLVNNSPTSQYGAAVQINSPDNDVDITTSGIVNVHGKSATWQGAFFVTGGAVSTDVLIKDATLNITNIQDTEFETLDANKKNTFLGEISNAMTIYGKGKVEITGDAVVNAYAERNGTKYTNRAHGLFLNENLSLIISGNADVTFAAGGDSKANTGAGIHLKQSSVTVTDNATLRVNASGTAVAGITFEGVSSLTVNKYGVALIDGGKDAPGVRGYNKSADVDINVKDGGHAQFTGNSALDLKNGTFEYSVSKVIAGKDKESSKETAITVVQREYKDLGYVVLKGQMRNPSTSDYVITYVVVAAVLAAAAAVAVIVIRKKKSQD